MGRYYWNKREEADCLKTVSVFFLKKHKYLEKGWKSGDINWSRNGERTGSVSIRSYINWNEQYIQFIYTQTDRYTGEKKDYDYKIPLTTTACYFGGKRYWFTCPWYINGSYCGRRVGVLYLGGDYFACRHCYNLTYNSRNLSGFSKIAGQVVSEPELENLRKQAKTQYYGGKMTKRYKQYLKKAEKNTFQWLVMAREFGMKL